MIPINDLFTILPALVLSIFACALLLMRLEEAGLNVGFALAGEALTALALWRQSSYAGLAGFLGSVILDPFGIFLNAACWLAAVFTILVCAHSLAHENEQTGDFLGLVLLAQAGMTLVVSGVEIVTVFVGLETAALSFYILTGFYRARPESNEAALKYFLLGALSTGLLLYGFSLLYGLTGSTRFAAIAARLEGRDPQDPVLLLALVTLLAGLFFKVAAAPFHMWAPDAYQGAPTPVSAFLATASKVASFALLLRLCAGPLAASRSAWEPLVVAAALLSLTIGNFAALTQQSVKRLLAYSSVAHGGYILLGLVAGNRTGFEGMILYLLIYSIMTAGAFLLLASFEKDDLGQFRGLLYRQPWVAVAMLVFLVSLAGLPPTAGFFPKYQIFLSLIQTRHYVYALIGALYVAVSLYYYFRIAREMILEPETPLADVPSPMGWRAAVGVASILTLALGINPQPALDWARGALR
ncbi:MAG: NADH-quinone oxidoreductase subunit N [Bryobacter sp.]|nr:NADH-quinone oxidoreductase subunit N [Bryobacter sp.]